MSKNTWRPSNIDEIFGQDHIKPVLRSWISNPDIIPKSLLLQGPYGDGKTSIARILAMSLASNNDIIETNAAEQRGIDDVRAIADSTRFSGFSGNKVYILDELHELTKQAQSALLKVIEEPPDGMYFILCTTSPSALQPMIRSRCHKLDFRNFTADTCFELVSYLTKSKMDKETSDLVFLNAEGHGRDIVKQVETFLEGGKVSYHEVQKDGIVSAYYVETALEKWAKAKQVDWNDAFKILHCGDNNLLARTVDGFVDHYFIGHPIIRKHYSELLKCRTWRKEYKIDGSDQWRHLLSIFSCEWYPDQ